MTHEKQKIYTDEELKDLHIQPDIQKLIDLHIY